MTDEEIDKHIGGRVRARRRELDMTQQSLGDALNVMFQQVQKYETGKNRISCSKLWLISKALGKPVEWFFEGVV